MLQLASHLRRAGYFVLAALTLPFDFEGRRKVEEASALVEALQDVANLVVRFTSINYVCVSSRFIAAANPPSQVHQEHHQTIVQGMHKDQSLGSYGTNTQQRVLKSMQLQAASSRHFPRTPCLLFMTGAATGHRTLQSLMHMPSCMKPLCVEPIPGFGL